MPQGHYIHTHSTLSPPLPPPPPPRQVVFWDQRFGWLELLYRHRLSNNPASRIEPLLDALHKVGAGRGRRRGREQRS